MLTTINTLRSRLELTVPDYDDLLGNAIKAVSARFEKECNRVFGTDDGSTYEFRADDTEIVVNHYPIVSVGYFSLYDSSFDGWLICGADLPDNNPDWIVRRDCIISLSQPIGTWRQQARVYYLGGYTLPGADPG